MSSPVTGVQSGVGTLKIQLGQKFLANFATHPVAAKFAQRLVRKSVTTSSVLVRFAEGLKEMGKRCISSSAWQTPERGWFLMVDVVRKIV